MKSHHKKNKELAYIHKMWRNPGRAHACGMPGGLPPHRVATSRDVRSPSGLRTSTVSRQFLLRSKLREAASRYVQLRITTSKQK
jgi:hypothetical protein